MPTHQQFLTAITATPDDVALRLQYADWLEEQGDPLCHEWRKPMVRIRIEAWDSNRRYSDRHRHFDDGDGAGDGFGDGNGDGWGDSSKLHVYDESRLWHGDGLGNGFYVETDEPLATDYGLCDGHGDGSSFADIDWFGSEDGDGGNVGY